MIKTTVYLDEEAKRALAVMARAQERSEAELIRSAIDQLIESEQPPKPRLPLFSSADPGLAERVDEVLNGFGE